MPKERKEENTLEETPLMRAGSSAARDLEYLNNVYLALNSIFPTLTQSQDKKNNENIYMVIFQYLNNSFFPIHNDDFFGSFNMVMRFVSERGDFAFKIKHYVDSWQLKILMLCVYNQESVEELIKKSNYTKRLATANQELSSNQELSFQDCKNLKGTYLKSSELLNGIVLIPNYEALDQNMAITQIMKGLQPADLHEILYVAIFLFLKNHIISDLALNLKKNESGTLVLPDPEQLEETKKTRIRSLNPRNMREEKEFKAKLKEIEKILVENQIINDIRNIDEYTVHENKLIGFLSYIINVKINKPNSEQAHLLFKIFIEDLSLPEQKETRGKIIRGEIEIEYLKRYFHWLLDNKICPSQPWKTFTLFSTPNRKFKIVLFEKIQNLNSYFPNTENTTTDQFHQKFLSLFHTPTEEVQAPETEMKTTKQHHLTQNQAQEILLQYAQYAHRKKTNKTKVFAKLAEKLFAYIVRGEGDLQIIRSRGPFSTDPHEENIAIGEILSASPVTTESDSIENRDIWRPTR